MLQHSNQTLESDNTNWQKLRDNLSELDTVEKAGLGLLGSYSILTTVPDLGESAEKHSEHLNLGGNLDLENSFKEIDDFLQENIWDNIWGLERKADTPAEAIPLMADKVGHYGGGYFIGKQGVKAADKVTTEYDPKKAVIGGFLAVGTYALFKEGLFEGGAGIQFDLDSPDVYADWAMDTAGMLHSTVNYHKQKTASADEEPDGCVTGAAKKAGQVYQSILENKGENTSKPRNNLGIYEDTKSEHPYLNKSSLEVEGATNREELQNNIIKEIASKYAEKSIDNIEDKITNAAQKILDKYSARIRPSVANKDLEYQPDNIIEEKINHNNMTQEDIEKSITSVVNRYKLNYNANPQ